ncbi:MAG: peptidase [Alphaproteobacteria bacterium]|nr:peptidase [Alphaproteobacteria bacterium]
METVSFTKMSDGTKADYDLLQREEEKFAAGVADRILDHLKLLDGAAGGYRISRLGHSLQSATRAEDDGADVDWIVTALLHDIGDMLAPFNHDSMAATILAPYVREECTWTLKHHGLFQLKYYGEHVGENPDGRDKFKDHPNYDACVRFCELWDQTSFDPAYPTRDLDHFVPMVREVFARTPWDPAVTG